jgi:hypothetical protein
MELDDLKNTWDNAANKKQQQNLTSKIIDQMTQTKYVSKINRIAYPEMIGSVICILTAMFIGFAFYKLETILFQIVGIICILLLLSISVISFLSLRKLKSSNDFSRPYANTLRMFATQKLAFSKLQKINITLSYLLLVVVIILLPKLFSDQDISDSKYFWMFSFSFGYIFLFYFSKKVSKYYQNKLRQSEELLNDLPQ